MNPEAEWLCFRRGDLTPFLALSFGTHGADWVTCASGRGIGLVALRYCTVRVFLCEVCLISIRRREV